MDCVGRVAGRYDAVARPACVERLYPMGMQVVLPDEALPATIKLNPAVPIMDDDEYFEFCMANRDLIIERTAQGEIIIVPPAGWESNYQSNDIARQLGNWAKRDGRGKAFGATAEFILPTRAAVSPDAAWVSNARITRLSKEQRRKSPPVCPEFVIEVMSPTDRLKDAQQKMADWIAAGVDLGWLIQGDKETVYIFRAGQAEPEIRTGIQKLPGEGPVAGFEADLTDIWAGL